MYVNVAVLKETQPHALANWLDRRAGMVFQSCPDPTYATGKVEIA